jgi:hypothetical protein
MKRDKRRTDSSKMFDCLVRNALDFLQRSAEELETAPNHSSIDFCTAIELFLKARLLSEHWTLVYDDLKRAISTNKASLMKFSDGDFVSVGMKDAIARLRELVNLSISKEAGETFVCISQHRNKLIHFFHPSFSQRPDATAIASVVAEQCRGWYHLYPLLTDSWRSIFAPYLSDIEKVQSLMRKNRAFLQIIYDARLTNIQRLKQEGIAIVACRSCGFEAMWDMSRDEPIQSSVCFVCATFNNGLPVKCPGCGEHVVVAAPRSEPHCALCSKSIALDDILDQYAPRLDSAEGAAERNRAFCGDIQCVQDSEQESALLFGNKWVCLHCFESRDVVWTCQRCGHLFLADEEGPLCIACEYAEDEQEQEWPSTSGGVM